MDSENLMRDELERLARAHLLAERMNENEETEDGAAVAMSAEMAATLRSALHASLTGATQEMTAIASVPASTPLPAEWLLRLEAPFVSAAQLEAHLGLASGSLPSLPAVRQAGDDRGAENVQFVFVSESIKARIEAQVRRGDLDLAPLFVKVAKAGAGA